MTHVSQRGSNLGLFNGSPKLAGVRGGVSLEEKGKGRKRSEIEGLNTVARESLVAPNDRIIKKSKRNIESETMVIFTKMQG